MMKDEELWLKKIKEQLDDYSEPLPVAGWERLEKSLPASASLTVGMKKRMMFRRWAMTAAAVALVAVSSVSLWLMQSPVVDDVRRSAEPALARMPDALPPSANPAAQGEQSEPVIRKVTERETSYRQSLVAQRSVAEDASSETAVKLQEEVAVVKGNSEQVAETTSSVPEERVRQTYRPSGKDKLHLPIEKKASAGSKGWALGLSVGNTGGLAMADNAGGNDMMNDPTTRPMFSDKLDLVSASNGIMDIPEGKELVFEDGVPYLRKAARSIKDIKHRQPISFGVSVRKDLPKNFSVETGVTYTLLASEITYEGGSEKVDQKLHYIGIPVRANWNFINNKRFTMYVSAGGAIEKCVYGKIAGEKETVKPVQLSVMGAVGAQYNISNRVGLYVEPGVSYFFDDGSPIETIRKENPTNFTLQAGIRLTY